MMDEKIQIVLQHKKNEPDIEIVQIKMNISKTTGDHLTEIQLIEIIIFQLIETLLIS